MKLFLTLGFMCISVQGSEKIVGGQIITIDERPYQASLQFDVGVIQHSCGASIISDKFLLTAAHCDPGTRITYLFARVGATYYSSGGQSYNVSTFLQHPQYVPETLDYDFAIVGFEDGITIEMGPTVAIVPLTSDNDPADDSLMTITGWGRVSESTASMSIVLREVDIPVMNQDECKKIFSFLTNRQICIGGTSQRDQSACNGDNGGPAVQNGIQYALVSGVSRCEAPNVPGLYARISVVRDWIRNETGV